MSVILPTSTELTQSQGILEVKSTYSGLPKPSETSAITQKNLGFILQHNHEGKIIQKRDVNPYLIMEETFDLSWINTQFDNFPNVPVNVGSVELPFGWRLKNNLFLTHPNMVVAEQIPSGIRVIGDGSGFSSNDVILFTAFHNFIERTISGNLPSSYLVNIQINGKLLNNPGITSRIYIRNSSVCIMDRVVKPSSLQLNHEITSNQNDVPFTLLFNDIPFGINPSTGTVRGLGISFPSNIPVTFELNSVRIIQTQ